MQTLRENVITDGSVSDPHMHAALHLSQELREAHLCNVFVQRGAAKTTSVKRDHSKRSQKSAIPVEPDLFPGIAVEIGSGKEIDTSRRIGHEICEHLLASLRKQIADEAGLEHTRSSNGSFASKGGVHQEQLSLI